MSAKECPKFGIAPHRALKLTANSSTYNVVTRTDILMSIKRVGFIGGALLLSCLYL